MMLRSGFFNSVNGDRTYNASRFAEYFATFIGNGVFPNPSTNLQVFSNNDMTITVKAGKAWINGYILINDDDYILSIAPADGVLNRIDRIVARFDVLGREITVEVKQGAFGSVPVAPALQRDADAFELGLADVYIGNGVVSINQGDITDLRLDNELCGIVHGVVDQVDTTTLFNQYTQGFELKKDEFEQEFMAWFQTLQDVLDENTATNLLNMINANTGSINTVDQKVDAHLAEDATQAHMAKNIGLEDAENNFTATEVEGALTELFTNVSNGKNLVGGAITDVDPNVVVPADPTFQQLADSIGQISTGLISELIPGNSSIYNDVSTKSTNATSFTKIREVKMLAPGSVRVSFGLRNGTSYVYVYGMVYKNGVPVGTERVTANGQTYSVTYTEDFTVNKNDLIQIYIKVQISGHTGFSDSFSIGINTDEIATKII